MAKRAWIATAVLVVLAGLVAAGYRLMANREETFCGFCHRSIHANTKVIAEIDAAPFAARVARSVRPTRRRSRYV